MLTIANFQANYYLPKGTPNAPATQKRFDRLLQGAVVENIAQHLHPSAQDAEAVYRIRRLETELWADLNRTTDGEFAQIWAQLLTRSVVEALLKGQPTNVVRYESHAHFVAAFLGDLLIGQAWSRWMYEEFAPLRDLPPGQVAVYILAAKPELLVPVAAHLAQSRQLDRLLHTLTPQDAKLLWERAIQPQAPPAWYSLEGATVAYLEKLQSKAAIERGQSALRWRNAVRLYLAVRVVQFYPQNQLGVPSQTVKQQNKGPLSGLSYHLALLAQLWSVQPAPALWQALAAAEISSPEAIAPLLRSLDGKLNELRDWLATVIVSKAGRAYLARLVPIVASETLVRSALFSERSSDEASSTEADSLAQGDAENLSRHIHRKGPTEENSPDQADANNLSLHIRRKGPTAFAGLGLILPLLRDLALFELVGRKGLYQLLLAAVGTTLRPLAWSEEAVAWLAGIPYEMGEVARAAEVDWATVAEKLAVDLGQQTYGLRGATTLADAVLDRFTRGLRGFEESSPAYLREQFIHLPGQVHMDDERVTIYMSHAPLGIVLQMAGRAGEQGPLPWLENRQLWIQL